MSRNQTMSKILHLLKQHLRLLFLTALALVTVLMLWPFPPSNEGWIYTDKIQHVLVFCMLSYLGIQAYSRWPGRIAIGLMVYGAAIELLQAALTSTRQASLADWLADCVGIALGFIIYYYFHQTDVARI